MVTRYAYQAIDTSGRRVSGQLEASGLDDLATRLQHIRLDLVRARPAIEKPGARDRLPGWRWFSPHQLRRERINFVFQLEQLVRAGVPILDALTDLAASAEHPRWQNILTNLHQDISGGKTLSQALAEFPTIFDTIFISLIAAGELSGQLPEILHRLGESLRWEDELRSETKRLLLYPVLVASFIVAAAAFLLIYLVPELKAFINLTGNALPLYSQILFAVSDFLVINGKWLLIFLVVSVFLGKPCLLLLQAHSASALFIDRCRLKLPIVGKISKKMILARFAGLLALLYASGIPVVEAINTLRSTAGNRVAANAFENVLARINEGDNLSRAFACNPFFPLLLLRMLQIGEQTGSLNNTLSQVGYFYQRDVKEATTYAQTLIEPALTLVLGLFLAWIMLSVLGPVYDVLTTIRF